MNWIQKLWPRRAKAKSNPGAKGALVPAYGQDLQHPDELINRANKRAVKGDLDGAIADFDAAIELNPAKATTFYNRGYLNNLAGNHEQALRDCSEAIALLPDYDEAFFQRGVAHQELAALDAAVVDFSEVLRLNPFSIKAYYKRASCYAARDDIQGAVADYTQAILRVPKDPNAYLQRGIFLTKLQEYRTAIADFSSALSFNPKHADAYYHRGYCYAELGETEKATQDFNQAMLYDPSQRVADYNRSYALGILKETKNLPPAASTPTASSDSLRNPAVVQDDEVVVLSLNSDDPPVLMTDVSDLSLDDDRIESESIEQAEPDAVEKSRDELPEDFGVSLEEEDATALYAPLSPERSSEPQVQESPSSLPPPSEASPAGALVLQSEVEALFANAQHQAQLNNFEEAIATYSQIIELEPNNARAYLERGQNLNAIGRGEDAAVDVDTAVHLAKKKSLDLMKDYNSTLSQALADLKGGLEWETHPSSALVRVSDNNQSIEGSILKYSQLIHRNPLDVHAYFERAKSRALLGDLEGAIADYTRTIALDDKYRDAYYKRGMLLSALGDTDGATQDMNKAILRKPLLPSVMPPSSKSSASSSAPPSSKASPPSTPSVSIPVRETVTADNRHANDTAQDVEITPDVTRQNVESLPLNEYSSQEITRDDRPSDSTDSVTSLDESEYSDENQRPDPIELDAPQGLVDEIEPKETETASRYFSDLVLEPCNHEGNDPAHRFCIHCGQSIQPTL